MKKSLNKIFFIFKIYFFISYYLLSLYNPSVSKSLMTWLAVSILFSFNEPRNATECDFYWCFQPEMQMKILKWNYLHLHAMEIL